MKNQETWTINTDQHQNKLSLIFMGLFGFSLMICGLLFNPINSSNILIWCGLFFLSLMLFAIIFNASITTHVNPLNKSLRIINQNRLHTEDTLIPFAEVDSIRIRKITRRNMLSTYHLKILLKNGKQFSLGQQGLTESAFNKITDPLAQTIGCPVQTENDIAPLSSQNVVIAATCAILAYLLWYRITVGPWCPAMWGGTAPIFIMTITFFIVFNIAGRINR